MSPFAIRAALLTLAVAPAVALRPGPEVQSAAAPLAVFSFQPKNVVAGGTLSVAGWRFDPLIPAAALTIVDVNGNVTPLGLVVPQNGAFQAHFTVPNVPPGRYHVGMQDSNLQVVVNLVGTLRVVPTDYPVFGFRQTALVQGGNLSVGGGGFRGTSATVGLMSRSGQRIVLGTLPVAGGALNGQVPVSPSLALGAYFPFVRDSAALFAQNVSGPLTVIGTALPQWIPTGLYPIGAVSDPDTDQLFVPNGLDNTLSIIDETSRSTVATLPIGGLPCAIGLNPVTHRVFVANAGTDDVSVIDGLTNSVIATVPVGGNAPCGAAVLPDLNRAYFANYGSDNLSVIDGATNTLIDVVPVGRGPFAVATNPATNRVYVAGGFGHNLQVLDGATLQLLAQVPVGRAPDAIGVNPVTNRIYVGNYFSDTLSVVDGTSNTVLATIPTGAEPSGVAVDPVLDLVYVSNWMSQTATVLDGTTFAVLGDVLSGLTPDGAVVNPVTHKAYIVNSISNNVTVIDGTTYR
jgi:YVTN family beta-propeller protein